MPGLADAEITLSGWQTGALALAAFGVALLSLYWIGRKKWVNGRTEYTRAQAEFDREQFEAQQEAEQRRRDSDAERDREIRAEIEQLKTDREECRKENAAMRLIVRRLTKQMANLSRKLMAKLPSTPFAEWKKDEKGRYVEFNDRFLQLVLVARGGPVEVEGKTDLEVFGEQASRVLAAMDARAARAEGRMVSESNVSLHPNLPPLTITKVIDLMPGVTAADSSIMNYRGWALVVPPAHFAGSGYEIPAKPS